MKISHTFNVVPSIPEELKSLEDIAYNLWFTWHREAINLFHRLDPVLWEQVNHNPVEMLGKIEQAKLEERRFDEGYRMQLERVKGDFDRYKNYKTSYNFNIDEPIDFTIAYFSAEFGLSDSLPIYSGGLGILAGDHMKSASDIRVPLVGVGLLYQEGYFRQYLNADGWQQETYPENDFSTLCVRLVRQKDGSPLYLSIPMPAGELYYKVWQVAVGRNNMYLLDTNTHKNRLEDRSITAQLYGGDNEMRICQEILLGIGGTRALYALGITPSVFHLNEGHSAFAILERIHQTMEEMGISFAEAREIVVPSTVFTTHTPVPAGVDRFSPDLIEKYFTAYVKELGITVQELLAMGRIRHQDQTEPFCMLALAMRLSGFRNAVSKLHTKISRRMWHGIWQKLPTTDVPIEGVTNGIHIPSWISTDMAGLYDRYLGRRWMEDPDNQKVWERINTIPDSELWRTHERRRERLVAFARRRLDFQLRRRGAPKSQLEKSQEVLNPEALTIGFARRFATYKRAYLIFKDPDRLARILQNSECPVQIIFAGKAHPRDMAGKQIIKNIIHFMKEEPFRSHMAFIEDYDINVARYMVQGVDVWLNTPRRPEEACGTSGMKAAANGALNMSILDGWWDEAFDAENGWAIGKGEEYADHDYQDAVESRAIYSLLEEEVVPRFYRRGADKIPKQWVKMMKHSLTTICTHFNTHRMVEDYLTRFYYPASKRFQLAKDNPEFAHDISQWKQFMQANWKQVNVLDIQTQNHGSSVTVKTGYAVSCTIQAGPISPKHLEVDLYYGRLDAHAQLTFNKLARMECASAQEDGVCTYTGVITPQATGKFGFAVRILPKHHLLFDKYSLGLIYWS